MSNNSENSPMRKPNKYVCASQEEIDEVATNLFVVAKKNALIQLRLGHIYPKLLADVRPADAVDRLDGYRHLDGYSETYNAALDYWGDPEIMDEHGKFTIRGFVAAHHGNYIDLDAAPIETHLRSTRADVPLKLLDAISTAAMWDMLLVKALDPYDDPNSPTA